MGGVTEKLLRTFKTLVWSFMSAAAEGIHILSLIRVSDELLRAAQRLQRYNVQFTGQKVTGRLRLAPAAGEGRS